MVQLLRVQGQEWSVTLVSCQDRVQIRTEEYRVIEVIVSVLRSVARR
jgi:hypothetical protein